MTLCVASNAVSDQESSCARETKKGYSSRANKECPFPDSGIVQSVQSGQSFPWRLALTYQRGNFVFVISAPKTLKCGTATYFCVCDQLVPLLRWCSQSVLSIDHGWQLGLNTTTSSTSRQYWGHHPRFNLVCSTSTCVRPSNRSSTGRAELEARTVK